MWERTREEVHPTSPRLGLDEAPFDYSFDYCSRWVSFDPERTSGRFAGKADAGLITITVDEDNVPLGAFRGTWTFDGALEPPAFTADLRLRYTITGGTVGGRCVVEDVATTGVASSTRRELRPTRT